MFTKTRTWCLWWDPLAVRRRVVQCVPGQWWPPHTSLVSPAHICNLLHIHRSEGESLFLRGNLQFTMFVSHQSDSVSNTLFITECRCEIRYKYWTRKITESILGDIKKGQTDDMKSARVGMQVTLLSVSPPAIHTYQPQEWSVPKW